MEKKCNLFENVDFQKMSQGIMRPGGYKITEDSIRLANLQSGMRVLDVGCGLGSTLNHLKVDFGINGIGIDSSDSILTKGRILHPELDMRKGDGDKLDFPFKTFDGVIMECTLSLFHNLENALNDAYYVLKDEGKLIISDFYHRNPNEDIIKQEKIRRAEDRINFFDSCISGAFDKDYLIEILKKTGYTIIAWEDRTKELKEFTAEIIMECGSMEKFWASILPEDINARSYTEDMAKLKLGYFLLVAKK
jgi:arsenite methyltransferase